MGRARGQNAIMAFGFESTYGTPATGFRKMPFVSSNLGAEQALIESDLLGQGRAPADPTYDVVTNDGDVVVPLDNIALGFWLKLLFGPPATFSFTGGFSHLFTSGATNLPSASIEIGHPDRPSYSTHYGVRANTLQINMQRGGLTSATLGLNAKGETVLATIPNATDPIGFELSRYAAATGVITADGVQIGEITSAQISYSNALEKDETIRPDGEINDVDPGMPAASISLTTKFAHLTLYNKATSKTPVALAFRWGSVSDRTLDIIIPRIFLPRVKRPITGPGGVMAEYRGIGASSAGGPVFSVQLNNAETGYA